MSADNWAMCPQCKKQKQKGHAALLKRIETEYGKISADECLALVKESQEPVKLEQTLREDWEIGIWEGKFEVNYRAGCTECGLSHTFKYSEIICTD